MQDFANGCQLHRAGFPFVWQGTAGAALASWQAERPAKIRGGKSVPAASVNLVGSHHVLFPSKFGDVEREPLMYADRHSTSDDPGEWAAAIQMAAPWVKMPPVDQQSGAE
jgi:hypothetical protein